MIFGFGKKKQEEEVEEEVEHIEFQGALWDREVDLASNSRLAEVGLVPTKELLTDCLSRRADVIRIDLKGDKSQVSMLIDGAKYAGPRYSKQQAFAVMQVLDLKLRGQSQSGGIKATLNEVPYELYIDTLSSPTSGERVTVTARNTQIKLSTPEEVGFSSEFKDTVRDFFTGRKGVVLVCGPPMSGTTTTVYAVLRAVDAYIYSVYSIRDSLWREVPYITQFEAKEGDDTEATLFRIIRLESDVVFVDPIKSAEDLKLILKFQDKSTFLSEMVAKDAAHGILQVLQWVEDVDTVVDSLRATISQKLIRALCPKCKEAYRPNPKVVEKLGLPEEAKILYRPPKALTEEELAQGLVPCEECGGTGFLGRRAIFEYIELTDPIREAIKGKASASDLKAIARKEGMLTLQKDGLRLVIEGATSLDELQRTFKQ